MPKKALLVAGKSKKFDFGKFNNNYFIVASGENVIPLFWFTLFTNENVEYFDCMLKNGTKIKIPKLVVDFEAGFERLCNRHKQFIKLIPPKMVYLYDKWAFLIQDIDTNYIHIDLSSLISNVEEFRHFDIYIQQILSIIDLVPDPNSISIIKEFIGITFKKSFFSKKIVSHDNLNEITALLCGSSWLNDKPWESFF
ncbi:MAG: hypothetical protein ABF289_01110 [Clostridiales bacterium]